MEQTELTSSGRYMNTVTKFRALPTQGNLLEIRVTVN